MRVIVNPVAANGAVSKRWPQMRDILRAEGGQFDASFTEGPGHATDLAREALSAGYRTIVAVGGDGTLNEVVNGLVNEGLVDPTVNLGIIPGGTGLLSKRPEMFAPEQWPAVDAGTSTAGLIGGLITLLVAACVGLLLRRRNLAT